MTRYLLLLLLLLTACNAPAAQPALPDAVFTASPALAAEQEVTGVLTVALGPGGQEFPYRLLLPASWAGQVTVEPQGESEVALMFQGTARAERLATIFALPEAEWQARQGQPDVGTAILAEEGIVFAYRLAPTNPFTGDEATRFTQLLAEVGTVIGSFTISPTEQGTG